MKLKNFKRFSSTTIDLSTKINLLLGPNSSGKSSVIKALLAFKQTASSSNEHEVFSAQGEYVDLGLYKDYVYKHNIKNKIIFEFTYSFHQNVFSVRNKIFPVFCTRFI